MATSFGALCADFYINQKLSVKMDLPADRETILHLFDRVRKSVPSMDRFHRYHNELALESNRGEAEYCWLALRRNSVRTGHVNPPSMAEAYRFHKLLLEVAPFNLTLSPLDVDYLELLFGFDLECRANHDEVVFEALLANGPLGNLLRPVGDAEGRAIDVQPVFGLNLDERGQMQAYFEIKTRTRNRKGRVSHGHEEPISLFVTVRRYGPVQQLEELLEVFGELRHHCETLATERLVPDLLQPIARQITSSNA